MAGSQKRIKALRAALLYLEMRGFKVIEQDYKTPRVVIDLVVSKKDIIYFIEVKVLSPKLSYQAIGSRPVPAKDFEDFTELWHKDTGIQLPVKRGTVELLAPDYSVFSFNYE